MKFMGKRICSGICAACLALTLVTVCGAPRVWAAQPSQQVQHSPTLTPIAPNQQALAKFFRALGDVEPGYNALDEVYDFAAARQYLSENIQPVKAHRCAGFIRDSRIDREALLQHVLENQASFDRMSHEGSLFYTELEDRQLLVQIIDLLAQGLEAELPSLTSEELAELDCVLGDLCIFESTGLSGAAVTQDNILTINQPMINMIALNAGADDGLRHTITHESKHLLQTACNERKTAPAQRLGVGYRAEALQTNPYSLTWLLEAAAERNTVLQLDEPAQTYVYLTGYLETLDLAGILSPKAADGYAVTKKALTRDREGLYALLGADSGMDPDELDRMLLAMEITQNRVEDFPAYYEKTSGEALPKPEYDALRKALRLDFLLSASKVYYLHLADALRTAKDATLEDVFWLLRLWEADLNYHLDYVDGTPNAETLAFMQAYAGLQQDFFAALSRSGPLSAQEIQEQFCTYQPFTSPDDIPNAHLRWISREKQDWLREKASGEFVRYAPAMPLLVGD